MVKRRHLWRRASDLFTEDDKKAIALAVATAEDRTSGEIIPVVATSSGGYERAEGVVGLIAGLIALSVSWLVFQDVSQPAGSWGNDATIAFGLIPILVITAAGFVAGSLLSRRLALLREPFVSRKDMTQQVERSAADAYQRFRVSRTAESTGIVLYISVNERMVSVVGDGAITEKLAKEDWEDVRDLILDGLKARRPVEGLCAAIARSGDILAQHFPLKPGDVNELRDELRLVD